MATGLWISSRLSAQNTAAYHTGMQMQAIPAPESLPVPVKMNGNRPELAHARAYVSAQKTVVADSAPHP